ncbi:Hha/YmoA family nucleoid-associated regulatory protein [Escherichia coli]
MTRDEYLMQFRRYSKLDTLEAIYDRMGPHIPAEDISSFESAVDHRRAEIIHNRLWDKVPASAWKYVN